MTYPAISGGLKYLHKAGYVMKKHITKPKNVNYRVVPRSVWRIAKQHLPKPVKRNGPGRSRKPNRAILNGIWFVLWTGCQWKSLDKSWFGVSSSVLHERFQTWGEEGIWQEIFRSMLRFYGRKKHILWKWQSVDSRSCAAPLGGKDTGPNPTDRAKQGSKIHLLVDQRGAPLAVWITGANQHDKWSLDDLVIHIAVERPSSQQHMCADKGYDYDDVHAFVLSEGYIAHIKHRRRRGEPPDPCPIPGETLFPARRWVVERTLGWLARRRSIRTRWCEKSSNWLAFVLLASASILADMAIFG
jgi:putative transposase